MRVIHPQIKPGNQKQLIRKHESQGMLQQAVPKRQDMPILYTHTETQWRL